MLSHPAYSLLLRLLCSETIWHLPSSHDMAQAPYRKIFHDVIWATMHTSFSSRCSDGSVGQMALLADNMGEA
jgi:hypothetical protein